MISENRTATPEEIDIERMATENAIRPHVVQRALDLPITCEPEWQTKLDAANTIDEIKAVYFDAPNDSPAEVAAMTKWIQLAIDSPEIQEACENAGAGSVAEATAIRKLATFFTKKP